MARGRGGGVVVVDEGSSEKPSKTRQTAAAAAARRRSVTCRLHGVKTAAVCRLRGDDKTRPFATVKIPRNATVL